MSDHDDNNKNDTSTSPAGPQSGGNDEWDPAIYRPGQGWVLMTSARLARRRAYAARPYVEPATDTPVQQVHQAVAVSHLHAVGPFSIQGRLDDVQLRDSLSGPWAWLEVRDPTGAVTVVVFPNLFPSVKDALMRNSTIRVHGYAFHDRIHDQHNAEISAQGLSRTWPPTHERPYDARTP